MIYRRAPAFKFVVARRHERGPDEVHKMVVARRILAQYEGKRGAL